MTDDGENYEYEWDAFYRLRKVKRTDNQALVAEYRYNGLGYRTAVHEDTDTDGDVDGSDLWFFDAFDERWRQVARYRESDANPKEEFVHHCAGNNGLGGSSYIDLVVCRNKDANTAWTSASDGTLEERVYYCQNQHADVSAIVSAAGGILEWAKYSAYGVPFGLPGGDADSDGDCDSADATQIQAWIDAPAYDVRGDLDLDGDVDAADKGMAQAAPFAGAQGGIQALSSLCGNLRGYTGALHLPNGAGRDGRLRIAKTRLGHWASRDPLGFIDGASGYEYGKSNPAVRVDPTGTETLVCGSEKTISENEHGVGVAWGTGTQEQVCDQARGVCEANVRARYGADRYVCGYCDLFNQCEEDGIINFYPYDNRGNPKPLYGPPPPSCPDCKGCYVQCRVDVRGWVRCAHCPL